MLLLLFQQFSSKCKCSRSRSSSRQLLLMLNLVLAFLSLIEIAQSHGRMETPAARNAAWRHGFKVPTNYNDLELNCGGVGQQHGRFGGRCGICGDSMGATVREHEVGGKYATGTIVKTYNRGDWIDIDIVLSANHLGYMQFKICATNSPYIEATQECLDQNVLEIQGYGQKYPVKAEERKITVKAKLPDGLVCSHCVLQWKYRAGNNWGTENGVSGLGVGPQEEFYNCADVQVFNANNGAGGGGGGIVWTTTTVPSTTRPIIIQTSTGVFQTSQVYASSTTPPLATTTTHAIVPSSTTRPIASSTVVPSTTYPPQSHISTTVPAAAGGEEESEGGETESESTTTSNQYIYRGKITCKTGFKTLDKFCYENCATPEKKCPEKICKCIWTE